MYKCKEDAANLPASGELTSFKGFWPLLSSLSKNISNTFDGVKMEILFLLSRCSYSIRRVRRKECKTI